MFNPISEPHFFECDCYSEEHTLKFNYSPEDREVYCTIFLDNPCFWKRIWRGIKYIFGYKSRYGDFYSWCLQEKDLESLIALLEHYRDDLKRVSPIVPKPPPLKPQYIRESGLGPIAPRADQSNPRSRIGRGK
jgi:hypothetical protein